METGDESTARVSIVDTTVVIILATAAIIGCFCGSFWVKVFRKCCGCCKQDEDLNQNRRYNHASRRNDSNRESEFYYNEGGSLHSDRAVGQHANSEEVRARRRAVRRIIEERRKVVSEALNTEKVIFLSYRGDDSITNNNNPEVSSKKNHQEAQQAEASSDIEEGIIVTPPCCNLPDTITSSRSIAVVEEIEGHISDGINDHDAPEMRCTTTTKILDDACNVAGSDPVETATIASTPPLAEDSDDNELDETTNDTHNGTSSCHQIMNGDVTAATNDSSSREVVPQQQRCLHRRQHSHNHCHNGVAANCCAICLADYKYGEEVCRSTNPNCSHYFHRACIIEWLLLHDECPCCRTPYLFEPGSEYSSDFARRQLLESIQPSQHHVHVHQPNHSHVNASGGAVPADSQVSVAQDHHPSGGNGAPVHFQPLTTVTQTSRLRRERVRGSAPGTTGGTAALSRSTSPIVQGSGHGSDADTAEAS
eukprot:CAMPEP_0116020502 /NCGR_PEP_ID=MMETSP0321-20121206/9833_1 /TAXON_ID=163516 /ORGANISM="Leptocylindrus danicus var. danicus, Strain B650" /LENGTH=478 /DNA_ID=CAMNT_0003491201 /DNA_START=374 /DNA_END=1810 /DNA_ORIENTATION=+